MYKDLLGSNREHVEKRMRDVDARCVGTCESEAAYRIRKNLTIRFDFCQNKVNRIYFIYSGGVSPKRVIEEISYQSGEYEKTCQMTYTIQSSAGAQYIRIDRNSERNRTIACLWRTCSE